MCRIYNTRSNGMLFITYDDSSPTTSTTTKRNHMTKPFSRFGKVNRFHMATSKVILLHCEGGMHQSESSV